MMRKLTKAQAEVVRLMQKGNTIYKSDGDYHVQYKKISWQTFYSLHDKGIIKLAMVYDLTDLGKDLVMDGDPPPSEGGKK
jgi:hypothetical protein